MSADASAALLSAVIGASVGAIGTWFFGWLRDRGQRKQHAEDARAENERMMVLHMLETIDDAIRKRATPSLFRPFRNPNVDLLLALPRLLLELPRQDWPVATWAAAQIQRSTGTVRQKTFVERIVNVQSRLVSWHRRDIDTDWFVEQLKAEPFIEAYRASAGQRLARTARDVGVGSAYLGLLGLMLRAVLSIVRS